MENMRSRLDFIMTKNAPQARLVKQMAAQAKFLV